MYIHLESRKKVSEVRQGEAAAGERKGRAKSRIGSACSGESNGW